MTCRSQVKNPKTIPQEEIGSKQRPVKRQLSTQEHHIV